MFKELSEKDIEKYTAIIKANQKERDAALTRGDSKDYTSFTQLTRTEYDFGSGQTRIGIVHRKDGEEKVFFRGETPDEGFVPVLIPYRGK